VITWQGYIDSSLISAAPPLPPLCLWAHCHLALCWCNIVVMTPQASVLLNHSLVEHVCCVMRHRPVSQSLIYINIELKTNKEETICLSWVTCWLVVLFVKFVSSFPFLWLRWAAGVVWMKNKKFTLTAIPFCLSVSISFISVPWCNWFLPPLKNVSKVMSLKSRCLSQRGNRNYVCVCVCVCVCAQ